MKHTVIIAKAGPSRIKIGSTSFRGGTCWESSKSAGAFPKKYSPNALALKDAIEIGAIALREKCLRMASCAKSIPARGALKPAAIAAATPHPINISGLILSLKKFLMNRPMVDPKCTRAHIDPPTRHR